eukprot:Gb_31475 [translate_table: standard]
MVAPISKYAYLNGIDEGEIVRCLKDRYNATRTDEEYVPQFVIPKKPSFEGLIGTGVWTRDDKTRDGRLQEQVHYQDCFCFDPSYDCLDHDFNNFFRGKAEQDCIPSVSGNVRSLIPSKKEQIIVTRSVNSSIFKMRKAVNASTCNSVLDSGIHSHSVQRPDRQPLQNWNGYLKGRGTKREKSNVSDCQQNPEKVISFPASRYLSAEVGKPEDNEEAALEGEIELDCGSDCFESSANSSFGEHNESLYFDRDSTHDDRSQLKSLVRRSQKSESKYHTRRPSFHDERRWSLEELDIDMQLLYIGELLKSVTVKDAQKQLHKAMENLLEADCKLHAVHGKPLGLTCNILGLANQVFSGTQAAYAIWNPASSREDRHKDAFPRLLELAIGKAKKLFTSKQIKELKSMMHSISQTLHSSEVDDTQQEKAKHSKVSVHQDNILKQDLGYSDLGVQLKGEPMESTQETISGETPNLACGYKCNLVAFEAIERSVGAGDVDFNPVSYCKQWKGKEEPSLFHHGYRPFNSLNSWDNVKGKWDCENCCPGPSEPVKSQPSMPVFSHCMPISMYNNGGRLNNNILTPSSGDRDDISDLEIDIYEDVTRYNETRCGSSSILVKGRELSLEENWNFMVSNKRRKTELCNVPDISSNSSIQIAEGIVDNQSFANTSPAPNTLMLPSVLKDVAVNPNMVLHLNKMEQQKFMTHAPQNPHRWQQIKSTIDTNTTFVSAVENVKPVEQTLLQFPKLEQKPTSQDQATMVKLVTKANSMVGDLGEPWMKAHDPCHVLHGSVTRKNKTSVNHNLKENGDTVSSGLVSRDIFKDLQSATTGVAQEGMPDSSMRSCTQTKYTSLGSLEHLLEGLDGKQRAAIQNERARRIKEQKKMFSARKLCLVLDLDHTLLNSAMFCEVDPVHEEMLRMKEEKDRDKPYRHLFCFPHMGMWTKLRPGIWNFLERASKLYELHIYTMAKKAYATEMAKVLDPTGKLFAGRIISKGDEADSKDVYDKPSKSKDLDGVLGMESAVVIIDDSENVWPHHRQNLILVERYTYFPCSRHRFGLLGPSLLDVDCDERPEDGTLATSLVVRYYPDL